MVNVNRTEQMKNTPETSRNYLTDNYIAFDEEEVEEED